MKKRSLKIYLIIIFAVFSVAGYKGYEFYYPKHYSKELIDDSVNMFGKDKLDILKIKGNNYLKVTDILGGKTSVKDSGIASGDYNNRVNLNINSKEVSYYSEELNRDIKLDYSDLEDFYIVRDSELYINKKYFNLVCFGFGNQLIETEEHYKYIVNYKAIFEDEWEELEAYKEGEKLSFEEQFNILLKAIETYHPSLDKEMHKKNIEKYINRIIKSKYQGFFSDNMRKFLDEYHDRHFSFENIKDESIELDILDELLEGSKIKFVKGIELKYGDEKIIKIGEMDIYKDKFYKEAVKKNSYNLFLEWTKQFCDEKNIVLESGSNITLEKTMKEIVDENYKKNKIWPMKFKRLNKDTLLIDIDDWNLRNVSRLPQKRSYKECKNIIIDIRDNGGGYVSTITDMLRVISNRKIKGYTIKNGKVVNEKFSYTDNDGIYVTKESISPIKGNLEKRIIVLTNEISYSASNDFAILIKENKIGTLIGEKTGGGAYTPRFFYQNNGNLMGIPSSFGLVSADGYDYEKGIEPDIYVKDKIIDGKDIVLERALEELKS